MSRIPTKEIDGDVAIGRNVTIGGRATVRGNVKVGHNLRVEGWLDAPNVKGPNKGVFLTEDDLKSAYPRPQNGWWALVGDTLPAPLYIAKGGKWEATGEMAGETTIDCDQYNRALEGFEDRLQTVETEAEENGRGVENNRSAISSTIANVGRLTERVDGVETRVGATEQSIQNITDSVGKANGIAPLDGGRKVPARYMLPELYDVMEFDGVVDEASVTLKESFETSTTEDYEERIVWLSAAGRFAAEYVRSDGGVSTLALGDSVGGGVGAAKTYYTSWTHRDRWCDVDGRPLRGKLYRCMEGGGIYGATRDCKGIENIGGRVSGGAESSNCDCEPLSIAEIDAMMEDEPDIEPTEAQRIDESEIDRLIDGLL